MANIKKVMKESILVYFSALSAKVKDDTTFKLKKMRHTVKCNNCDFEGQEEDLTLVEFDINDTSETPTATEQTGMAVNRISEQPKERGFLKGCPNCLTDANLMDLNN